MADLANEERSFWKEMLKEVKNHTSPSPETDLRLQSVERTTIKLDETMTKLHEQLENVEKLLVKVGATMVTKDDLRAHEEKERLISVGQDQYKNDKAWVKWTIAAAYGAIVIISSAVWALINSQMDNKLEKQKNDIVVLLEDKINNIEFNLVE